MNVAEEAIDWLRTEQLQAAEEWSYLLPTGFSWWADQYLQTIEIVGEETGPTGETGYLVCVRTELLRDMSVTDASLEHLNAMPMRIASLSGPVYDVPARRLDLWSLVRVTDDNGGWIRYLLGAAAVTQLAEARLMAPVLAEAIGAKAATSDHPESGPRTIADQMVFAAGAFVSSGDGPPTWTGEDFAEVADSVMGGGAMVDGAGLRADFPFGADVSECRLSADQPHPLYGNGLHILQRFPITVPCESDGIRMALSLNGADLTRQVNGYGLGSYVYADGALHFTGFVPNGLYRPGLLANLYASCAARAQMMAARFTEGTWDADAFALDAAVLARRAERQRAAAAPAAERPLRGCPMMRSRASSE